MPESHLRCFGARSLIPGPTHALIASPKRPALLLLIIMILLLGSCSQFIIVVEVFIPCDYDARLGLAVLPGECASLPRGWRLLPPLLALVIIAAIIFSLIVGLGIGGVSSLALNNGGLLQLRDTSLSCLGGARRSVVAGLVILLVCVIVGLLI